MKRKNIKHNVEVFIYECDTTYITIIFEMSIIRKYNELALYARIFYKMKKKMDEVLIEIK